MVLAQSRIAFIDPTGQLATINPDGTELRIISKTGQRLQFPAWSPDGEKLAVIGIDRQGGFIQILSDATDTPVREIYRSAQQGAIYLYWSPNGQVVSFLANHPVSGLALHVASEAQEDRIIAQGAPFYWQWAGDNQYLFIHTGLTGERARLGYTSVNEDTLENNLAPPGVFQSPGISPSGDYIAYAEDHPVRGTQVIVQNNPLVNSEHLRREIRYEGAVALGWSPAEDKLAFISPARDAMSVYGPLKLLEAESGLLEELTEATVLAFFWSPDGRYIAYLTPLSQNAPGRVSEMDQAKVDQKIQGSALFELRVIELSTRQDTLIGAFTPTFLFVSQFLPFFDQYALSHSIWSPQSDAIVLPVVDAQGQERITVFPLEGSPRSIADGNTPFWNRR